MKKTFAVLAVLLIAVSVFASGSKESADSNVIKVGAISMLTTSSTFRIWRAQMQSAATSL